MKLCAYNVLTEASSVTHGGTAGGGSLSDVNVLMLPWNGDHWYTSKTAAPNGAPGTAFVEFDFGGKLVPVSLAAMVPTQIDSNFFCSVQMRAGGSGGTLVVSQTLWGPGAFGNSKNFPQVAAGTFANGVVDYIKFSWYRGGTLGSTPMGIRRFYAGRHVDLDMGSDALGFEIDVLTETNDFGQPTSQDVGLRREVSFTATFKDETQSMLTGSETALSQIARAGLSDEVLLIASDYIWNVHGHFVGQPKMTRLKGRKHRMVATVREF